MLAICINPVKLINHQQLGFFVNSFNSWAFSIRNASSPHKSLRLFTQMQRLSIPFDSFSLLFTLKSCSSLQDLSLIRHLHAHLLKLGFNSHVYVSTSLLHGYVMVSFGDARLWFDEMPNRNVVTWNTMITGYSKLGDLDKARTLFENMPVRDLTSWSAMIAGYMSVGDWEQGLALFREVIVNEALKPDQITLGSILSCCAHMGSIGLLVGKSMHGFAVKNRWELNVEFRTVLVEMYAKCGLLKSACRIFDRMKEKNVMTWSSLICGSAQHGYGREALAIFEKMKDAGVRPNEITFTGILSACSRVGLIDEGQKYFRSMTEDYRLEPNIHHYGCMVDLLSKAGRLEEAFETIKTMKHQPNVIVWTSILSSCKIHKQFEIAERVIKQVLQVVKPENDGGVYSLICDLYVLNGKWEDAERVRKLMVTENVKKARGYSFIRSGTT